MHSYFRIVNELDRLLKSALTPDQWNARITKLVKRLEREEAHAIPLLLRKLRHTQDPGLTSLIVSIVERIESPTIVEQILEVMRDPSVTDAVKVELLPFLLRRNVDLSSPHLAGTFKDPRSILRTLTGWLLDGLAHDEDAIAHIVEDVRQWDRESQKRWLENFGERGDERALPLLATMAESWDVELARMAIATIARIPSGRTISALENLFNHREALWGEIERTLWTLRAMGISAQPLFPSRGSVRECWITHMDGTGTQLLLIVREEEAALYDTALFTLNDHHGIVECFSTRRLTAHEVHSVVAIMRSETPIAPVSYEEARALVRDALFAARRHRALICPEFAFRRRIFGEDDLSPKEYCPEFPSFLLADVRRQHAELLATSDRLLTLFPFSEWYVETPAAYEFLARWKLSRAHALPSLTRRIVLAFIEEVLEPEREVLIRRLARTAEFLRHLIGSRSAHRPIRLWKATLALWNALCDRRRSLSKIPFFHELARVSLLGLLANPQRRHDPSQDSQP
jgi:hypothetical protein